MKNYLTTYRLTDLPSTETETQTNLPLVLPPITNKLDLQQSARCNSPHRHHYTNLAIVIRKNIRTIYTYRSVHKHSNSSGIYSSINNSAIRQPGHISIVTAEAMVLVIAADEVLRRDEPNVIYIDSASVLQDT